MAKDNFNRRLKQQESWRLNCWTKVAQKYSMSSADYDMCACKLALMLDKQVVIMNKGC